MKRCGLIGSPVVHSLSAVMQAAAFAETGIDGRYELWETAAADVPSRVEMLREDEFYGANVTVPHKQRVMAACDDIADTARRVGAVNTIINQNGRLIGDNTDAYGFEMTIRASGIGDGAGLSAVLLGAGGAARAVLVALQEIGFGSIAICNRSKDKAAALASEFSRNTDVSVVNMGDVGAAFDDAALVVNATSLGWHADEIPVPAATLASLPTDAIVADLTYRDTEFLREARARGLATSDGLMMLVHQGARAFSLWTNVDAPVEAMKRAVIAEQRARSDS